MKITSKQYAQTLFGITDGKSKSEIEKSVLNFARYIYRKRELKLAEKIIEQFAAIYNKEKGIVEAEVITREKMDEVLEKKMKQFVREKYEAKEVVLKNIINKNIKGGLVLKVGDEILDGSVRGRLNELNKILTR